MSRPVFPSIFFEDEPTPACCPRLAFLHTDARIKDQALAPGLLVHALL